MTARIGNRFRTGLALLVGSMIVFCLHALAFAQSGTAIVAATATTTTQVTPIARFTRRLYIGGGFGASTLEPEDECPCIGVSDDSSSGHHLMVGYDLSRWLSAEVYFADLGESEIEFLGTDVGPVEYSVAGVSAIAYLVNSQSGTLLSKNNGRGMHRREGLSIYTRLGLGTIDNDTDLDYHRDYSVHLAAGLGAEYGFKNGFAIRGEYTAFDTDAQYASFSILKRFGKVAEAAPITVAAVVPTATPDSVIEESREITPTVAPFLYFGFDDDQLSATAEEQLKAYAAELAQSDYSFVVEGHADWIGSENYNQSLSERRADAVYRYLIAQGIPASRMGKKGYGESRPNNSNHTAAGRSQNRRVEFFIN